MTIVTAGERGAPSNCPVSVNRSRVCSSRQAGVEVDAIQHKLAVHNHGEVIVNLFNKLPGFVRSAPGLEHLIWRRLPTILLWGTLLPLALVALNRALSAPAGDSAASNGAMLLWEYRIFGAVVLHWTLVLTVALGCFIVRVMKGPAYVADAYPLPADNGASVTKP